MRSALHPETSVISRPQSVAIIHPRIEGNGTENCMALDIVIMAAGKGTRMKSTLPKVLHKLAGRPLLQHVLQTASELKADGIVVITGHGAEEVEGAVAAPHLAFARQMPQLGTGHAVQQALPKLHDEGTTLVLSGDVPLMQAA